MRKRAIGTQFALKKILLDTIKPMVQLFKYGAKIIDCNSHSKIILDTGWKIKLAKTPENRLMIDEVKSAAKARM